MFFSGKESKKYNSMREFAESQYTSVRVSGMGDYFQYDYKELMEEAQVVAVVKSINDLTVKNSFGISETGDTFFYAFSLREVEVIESFKGEFTAGEKMEVAEKCILLENGTMVASEDCYPMRKGDYYLLFLSRSGYAGSPLLPISADNGKCDLTNLYLNSDRRKQLFIEACSDLLFDQNDFSRLNIIPKDELSKDQTEGEKDWETILFTTPYTDKGNEIEIKIGHENGEIVYQIGNYYYVKLSNDKCFK